MSAVVSTPDAALPVPAGPAGPPAEADPDALSWRRPFRIGIVAIIVAFGGAGGWAALAPLESAAIAPAEVVVSGNTKTIDHLEGGIVSGIFVQEGSEVEAGQILIRLDQTRAKSQVQLLETQYYATLAMLARLEAEQQEKESITFPEELDAKKDDIYVRSVMDTQIQLFEARRRSYQGQVAVLLQSNEQHQDEIEALRAQQRSEGTQLELIEEEIGDVKSLVNQGLERKARLLSLQRMEAEIAGSREARVADMARIRNEMAETELRILDLENQRLNEVADGLRETRTQRAELEEQLHAERDVLRRTEIVAPLSGYVVGLQAHTIGGVVKPGDKLMSIVPIDEPLIVEAQVSPNDIDVVHVGEKAKVMFSSLNQRTTPQVYGKVVSVSADRLEPERSGQAPYYLARIDLDPQSLKDLSGITLQQGMPAEAIITTGERTVLTAILGPFRDVLALALRVE